MYARATESESKRFESSPKKKLRLISHMRIVIRMLRRRCSRKSQHEYRLVFFQRSMSFRFQNLLSYRCTHIHTCAATIRAYRLKNETSLTWKRERDVTTSKQTLSHISSVSLRILSKKKNKPKERTKSISFNLNADHPRPIREKLQLLNFFSSFEKVRSIYMFKTWNYKFLR